MLDSVQYEILREQYEEHNMTYPSIKLYPLSSDDLFLDLNPSVAPYPVRPSVRSSGFGLLRLSQVSRGV